MYLAAALFDAGATVLAAQRPGPLRPCGSAAPRRAPAAARSPGRRPPPLAGAAPSGELGRLWSRWGVQGHAMTS